VGERPFIVGLAVAGTLAVVLGTCVRARTDSDAAYGIRLLTESAHEEAIECGRAGRDCAVTPYLLCPLRIRGYSASLITPYSRVASYVFDGLRRGQRLKIPEPGTANRWGVAVLVQPAEDPEKADSIQSVEVRRGEEIIRPTTATLAPVPITRRVGETVQVSKGFFAFPMSAFSSDTDLSVVFFGSSGEAVCTLDRARLLELR
jgi:hypothetical protein